MLCTFKNGINVILNINALMLKEVCKLLVELEVPSLVSPDPQLSLYYLAPTLSYITLHTTIHYHAPLTFTLTTQKMLDNPQCCGVLKY